MKSKNSLATDGAEAVLSTLEQDQTLADIIGNLDSYIDSKDLEVRRQYFKAMARGFNELASYAEAKQHAMESRATGKIEMARTFEKCCDVIYTRLPAWARW